MDKHQDYSTQEEALMHIFSGENIGLLSESGLPCLADPGNKWVMAAHQMGIKVRPISGPSSIFLLLIASGLNGQNFAFHGYLPKESTEKKQKLKELALSAQKNTTHIFIETPYRNNSLLTELVSLLDSNMFLSVGINISTATEIIKTHTIREWKQLSFQIPKEPCIFAFGNSRS
jgi:16S rRNA (cytidine1402-2'-O)-methyltransferase